MRNRYLLSCAAVALLTGVATSAAAADAALSPDVVATDAAAAAAAATDAAPVGEVIVTAQRRNESVQKVPFTVQAFTGQTLQQLNVTTFDDLLKYTPNVTFGNNGPGQGAIFMRGLSAGFAGGQSSATIANFPNVALYLDDQSMQFPARNVDIYMADMERVEVLEGPQGTLFGGGAEAGAVRYITNKPKLNTFEGHAEGMYGFTSGGADNSSFNVMLNVPLIQDKLAVRAVFYNDRHGGYIDNVQSTFTRSNSDLGNFYFNIHPTGGLCPNHLPAGPAGLCTLGSSPQQQINNAALAQSNFNPMTYEGGRVEALYQINDDWNVLITESLQSLDSSGMFADYPTGSDFQTLKSLEVTSFTPSFDRDSFQNTAWTVNGKVGPLNAVYTGGYMSRRISQQQDYTNYSRTGGGMYYQCTGGTAGLFGAGTPLTCYSPAAYWRDNVRNTHLSNEVRLSTPDTWRLRGIVGVFNEEFRVYDVMNFDYKSIPSCNPANLAISEAGGAPCVADVHTAPNSTANDPGVRGDTVAFGEDTQRGYDQTAVFGSVDFDIIPHVLTITGGTRWYDYNEFEKGSQYGTSGACVSVANGTCSAGLVNIDNAHDKVTYTGFKSRANITWHVTPDTLTYFTFSQGFRPGGFNRSVSAVAPGVGGVKQYEKPNGYAPDSLTNYEIGLKTQLLDHRLQLNISAYYMNWENVQFLFYNPTELGNTTFGVNGPNYDVKGVEVQFVAHPIEGLSIQGSATYNKDTQTNSPCLEGNIAGTASFGQCITQIMQTGVGLVPFENPFGSPGSTPAFSPDWQADLRARYDWRIEDYKAYAQFGGSYTGSMFNQPATYAPGDGVLIPNTTFLRYEQPAYVTFDGALGVSKDRWYAQLFANNIFNSHASMFTSSTQFIKSEVPIRPRTFGLRVGANF